MKRVFCSRGTALANIVKEEGIGPRQHEAVGVLASRGVNTGRTEFSLFLFCGLLEQTLVHVIVTMLRPLTNLATINYVCNSSHCEVDLYIEPRPTNSCPQGQMSDGLLKPTVTSVVIVTVIV